MSSGTGYPERLHIHFPILGGFEGLNVYSYERSSLTLELTMLCAGGWTRSLLRCLPIWIILWSYEKATLCMLEQKTVEEATFLPYGCMDCNQEQYRGGGWLWCSWASFPWNVNSRNQTGLYVFWKPYIQPTLNSSQKTSCVYIVCVSVFSCYTDRAVPVWPGLLCSDMNVIQRSLYPVFGRVAVLLGAAWQMNKYGESSCLIYYHHTGHR